MMQSDLTETLSLLLPPLCEISPFLLVLDDDSRPYTPKIFFILLFYFLSYDYFCGSLSFSDPISLTFIVR